MPNPDFHDFRTAVADVARSRSSWWMPFDHKTTFNAGKLVPIMYMECLPGDQIDLMHAPFIRMSTPIHPVMDEAYADINYFFVPMRLVYDDFDKFFGANDDPWTNENEYLLPHIDISAGVPEKSILDYLGVPPNVQYSGSITNVRTINALPLRCYCKVWNDWWRDENLQYALDIPTDDVTRTCSQDMDDDNYLTSAVDGGVLLPVSKLHDYFTSVLPTPQRGPEVELPLNVALTGLIKQDGAFELRPLSGTGAGNAPSAITASGGALSIDNTLSDGEMGYFAGLGIDVEAIAGPTINQFRQAIAIQRIYELDARGGTRYNESVLSHFGVTVPDFRISRSEFLGSSRMRLNMSQVLQTSATNEVSPQGNTAAFSATGESKHVLNYAVVEHGYIIGVACVRNKNTYQNGIHKTLLRRRRFDFYTPELANLGELPVQNAEIYLTGNAVTDGEAFGFQEAYADYRYMPDRVSAAFRSGYSGGSLDVWHYADDYGSLPLLSDEWIRSDPVNINRTLAVSSTVEDQFIADFSFRIHATRVMPLHSVPGSLTHF